MSSEEWRMDAYYYSFERTGVDVIDKILSAVACAGKSRHHTQDWGDPDSDLEGWYPYHEGPCEEAWIQNAAFRGAKTIESLQKENAELRERLEGMWQYLNEAPIGFAEGMGEVNTPHIFDDWCEWFDEDGKVKL